MCTYTLAAFKIAGDIMTKNDDLKIPEGQIIAKWMGIGIAIFAGLGIPLSIITSNFAFIGIGPALGVAVGLSIGQGIENKYKKEGRLRPLTDAEKKHKKKTTLAGVAILTLGVIVFTFIFFLRA
jgi:hypothetical protein